MMENEKAPKPFKSWLDFYNSIKNTKWFDLLDCYGEIKYPEYGDDFRVTGIVSISKHELDTLVLSELLAIIPTYNDAKEMLYEVSMLEPETDKVKFKIVDMIISLMEAQSSNK